MLSLSNIFACSSASLKTLLKVVAIRFRPNSCSKIKLRKDYRMHYLLFYGLGVITGPLSPVGAAKEALAVLEPIILTALFASLLVPFAGFSRTEKWQKFTLQYALIPLFGMYTVVLW